MANPWLTNEERNNHHNVYSRSSMNESSFMRHNAGTGISWSTGEQEILVNGLARYSLEPTNVSRYVKIASHLQNKTVRDVAIRCKWLYNKENSKRIKEDHNGLEVNSTPASHQFVTSPLLGEEHEITCVLLKKNEQLFNQISANLTSFNLIDNINLFTKSLANIRTLLTNLNENVCEPMKRMPSLPVKLNEELYDELYDAFILPSNLPNLQNDGSLFFSPC